MRTRWPTKPPKDAQCDAMSGWSTDQTGAPVVHRCERAATVTALDMLDQETWLCADCAPQVAAKGRVRLNPKARINQKDNQ